MRIIKNVVRCLLILFFVFNILGSLMYKLNLASIISIGSALAAIFFLIPKASKNIEIGTKKKFFICAILGIVSVISIAFTPSFPEDDKNTVTEETDAEGSQSAESQNTESSQSTEEAPKPTINYKETFINSCQSYDYKEIFRNAESYKGQKATFTGEVIQVYETPYETILRVNVTKNSYSYEDTIYVVWGLVDKKTDDYAPNRILEDDIITIYGVLDGIETYESVLGSTVTLPKIEARYIKLN